MFKDFSIDCVKKYNEIQVNGFSRGIIAVIQNIVWLDTLILQTLPDYQIYISKDLTGPTLHSPSFFLYLKRKIDVWEFLFTEKCDNNECCIIDYLNKNNEVGMTIKNDWKYIETTRVQLFTLVRNSSLVGLTKRL